MHDRKWISLAPLGPPLTLVFASPLSAKRQTPKHFFFFAQNFFSPYSLEPCYIKGDGTSKNRKYRVAVKVFSPVAELLALHVLKTIMSPAPFFLHLLFYSLPPIARWSMSTNPCCFDSRNLMARRVWKKKEHTSFSLPLLTPCDSLHDTNQNNPQFVFLFFFTHGGEPTDDCRLKSDRRFFPVKGQHLSSRGGVW